MELDLVVDQRGGEHALQQADRGESGDDLLLAHGLKRHHELAGWCGGMDLQALDAREAAANGCQLLRPAMDDEAGDVQLVRHGPRARGDVMAAVGQPATQAPQPVQASRSTRGRGAERATGAKRMARRGAGIRAALADDPAQGETALADSGADGPGWSPPIENGERTGLGTGTAERAFAAMEVDGREGAARSR